MSAESRAIVVLALLMALGAPSCRLFRRAPKQAPVTPPPKPVATAPAPPSAPEPQPPELPEPPALPPGQPKVAQQPPPEIPRVKPWEPRRRVRSTPRPAPPAPEPEIAAEGPKPAPTPPPQLQQMLTPEQQRECNEAIDQSIARAQRLLAALDGRRINKEQAASAARIRAFLQQAQEARKTDLLTARALAERADVLAEDLVKSLQ